MRSLVMHRPSHTSAKRTPLVAFLGDEKAATAIEYSIMAAGIALVIVAVVNGIGKTVQGTFTTVQTGLK
jgi:pilus assembly protein Flp/PilA